MHVMILFFLFSLQNCETKCHITDDVHVHVKISLTLAIASIVHLCVNKTSKSSRSYYW